MFLCVWTTQNVSVLICMRCKIKQQKQKHKWSGTQQGSPPWRPSCSGCLTREIPVPLLYWSFIYSFSAFILRSCWLFERDNSADYVFWGILAWMFAQTLANTRCGCCSASHVLFQTTTLKKTEPFLGKKNHMAVLQLHTDSVILIKITCDPVSAPL